MDTLVCDWNDYAKLLCIEHNIDFRNQEYLLTFVCPTFKCLVDNLINNKGIKRKGTIVKF